MHDALKRRVTRQDLKETTVRGNIQYERFASSTSKTRKITEMLLVRCEDGERDMVCKVQHKTCVFRPVGTRLM